MEVQLQTAEEIIVAVLRKLETLQAQYPYGILRPKNNLKVSDVSRNSKLELVQGGAAKAPGLTILAITQEASAEDKALFDSIISQGLKIDNQLARLEVTELSLQTLKVLVEKYPTLLMVVFGATQINLEAKQFPCAVMSAPSLQEIRTHAQIKKQFWKDLQASVPTRTIKF
jgi:hypothetical protein